MNFLKTFMLIDLNCAFTVVNIVSFIFRCWIWRKNIVFDLLIICDLFQLWSNHLYFILYLLIVLAFKSVFVHLHLFPFLFFDFVLVYLHFLNVVLLTYVLYKYQNFNDTIENNPYFILTASHNLCKKKKI